MDTEQAQRFLAATQEDYAQRVRYYADLSAPVALPPDVEELREARSDEREREADSWRED